MVGVMPTLLSALEFSKIQQKLFKAQTRRVCDVFPQHGLGVNAIRIMRLAIGVTVSKAFLD